MNIGVDPTNKCLLTYDEFYKCLGKIVKLTHPEAYNIFKNNKSQDCLSMKALFKSLGGAWSQNINNFNYYTLFTKLIYHSIRILWFFDGLYVLPNDLLDLFILFSFL